MFHFLWLPNHIHGLTIAPEVGYTGINSYKNKHNTNNSGLKRGAIHVEDSENDVNLDRLKSFQ